jgi:protein SCO1/2
MADAAVSAAMTSRLRSAAVALTAILVGAAGLTACGRDDKVRTENPASGVAADDDGFHGTLVDPPLRPANVVLKDTRGAPFDLARPAPHRATALFFGFTNCDDVCPTTMADLAAARRSLTPALADKVTVVFVTVDPHRDTPPVLERWLSQFDQDFIGLIGSTELVNQAERSLYLPESGEESGLAADHATVGITCHRRPPTPQVVITSHRCPALTPVIMTCGRSMRLTTTSLTPGLSTSMAPTTSCCCTPVAPLHRSTPKTSLDFSRPDR